MWSKKVAMVVCLLGLCLGADPSSLGGDLVCARTDWVECDGCGCCFEVDKTIVMCQGDQITDIPAGLPENVTNVTFLKTGIVNLTAENYYYEEFHMYSPGSKLIKYKNIRSLLFKMNLKLTSIKQGAFEFAGNTKISHFTIQGSPLLENIPNFALGSFSGLQELAIKDCGLKAPPGWSLFSIGGSHALRMDLGGNKFKVLNNKSFDGLDVDMNIGTLVLENNKNLEEIKEAPFYRMKIGHLKLGKNPALKTLSATAFLQEKKMLHYLDLSESHINSLPTAGLDTVIDLILENIWSLKIFPLVHEFSSMKKASLTYHHHCCAFQFPEIQYQHRLQELKEFKTNVKQQCSNPLPPPLTVYNQPYVTPTSMPSDGKLTYTTSRPRRRRGSQGSWGTQPVWGLGIPEWSNDHVDSFGHRELDPVNSRRRFAQRGIDVKVMSSESWDETTLDTNRTHIITENCGINGSVVDWPKNVTCTPEGDAFNPCEDLMGKETLRAMAWIVVATALTGNMVVLIVTVFSKYKLTVSKFLMCNLAFADLTLGTYLLLLAAFDLRTVGVYFTYAIPWQYEAGCQAAGFLAIFSTCLSTFTLTAITMERWYAISHAIHLTKRLRLRQASSIMVCGWVFALIMAMLPLVGVSNYSKTAICLPMAVNNSVDHGYVISLLLINALAFFIILWCYVDMYHKVHGKESTGAGRNDVNIAKRMAVLVITDFACLFPVAFFGLTAACGYELINITESKILLVFFFPLNSCCNPFLYAMFTKQFKKDLFGMLSRCGLCEKRAAKYRMTFMYTSNPMSMSHSRHSNPHLITNRIERPTDHTVTSHNLDSRSSRTSAENKKCSSTSPTTTPTDLFNKGVDRKMSDFEEVEVSTVESKNDMAIEAEGNTKPCNVPEDEPLPEDSPHRPSDTPVSKTVRSASQYNYPIQGKYNACGNSDLDFDRRKVSQSTMLTLLSSTTDASFTYMDDSLTSGNSCEVLAVDSERATDGEGHNTGSIEQTALRIDKKNGAYQALPTDDKDQIKANGQCHNI